MPSAQLQVSEIDRAKFAGRSFFYVRMEILDAIDMPKEIFLWRRNLYDPTSGEQHDEFVTVCGVYDLVTYPANEPLEGSSPAFFRRATGIIKAPSMVTADEALQEAKDMISLLARLVDLASQLEVVQTVWLS